jgi:hypothetical protein
MLGKDDVNESEIEEMLEEYYRIAKLKGITSGPPSECGDDEKPKASKRSSKDCENKDGDKYIDYKEFAAMLQQ